MARKSDISRKSDLGLIILFELEKKNCLKHGLQNSAKSRAVK